MLNQIVIDISSVGRSTYTYKSVNCVNVYGRDVTLDLGRVYILSSIPEPGLVLSAPLSPVNIQIPPPDF